MSSLLGRFNKTEDIKSKDRRVPTNYSKLPAKGQKLSGQITDVQQNKISVMLEDGQVVDARLTRDFQFVIGDQVQFLVKDSSQGLLLLQPMEGENVQEEKLLSILKAAGLEDTPKNMELLSKLIEKGLPIDKKSLAEMVMYTKRFPEAKIDQLIFLKQNDIMITKDSLHYVEQLLGHKQSMSTNISSFNNEVANMVDKASGALVAETILKENEPAINVFTKVRNFFLKTEEQVQVPKEKLDFPMNKVMSQPDADGIVRATGKMLGQGTGKAAATVSPEQPQQLGDLTNLSANKEKAFSQLFAAVEELDVPDDIKQATNRLLAQRVTKSMLNNELMVNKDNMETVDKINKHYNKVYDRINDVLNLDLNDTSESIRQVLREAGNIKTSVEMMNQLQQNHQFLHIPMVINNQNVDSELYVMKKQGSNKKADERITALVRLDLRNLGQLDIYVAKTANNVEVNFYAEGDSTIDHIRNHSGELVKQLVEKSFNVLGVGVSMREKDFNIVDDFLESTDSGESKRFSFDMRA